MEFVTLGGRPVRRFGRFRGLSRLDVEESGGAEFLGVDVGCEDGGGLLNDPGSLASDDFDRERV